ncbi:hypothetical protein EYF80_004628 [Liparis tanakae]|uniref:Uncharacterized protein n=1 Tax=Liparis tanakae TaxID=230148 RepID=A0A4Z2J507_9TELE|nr:hypothetical protein EYF80_004628 [Liparis tanakae]
MEQVRVSLKGNAAFEGFKNNGNNAFLRRKHEQREALCIAPYNHYLPLSALSGPPVCPTDGSERGHWIPCQLHFPTINMKEEIHLAPQKRSPSYKTLHHES